MAVRPMNKRMALLYIGFANVLLLGQTATATPPVDRVTQLSTRFRPELNVPLTPSATLFESTCVYRSPDTKSLSVKPCVKDARKLPVMPPSERIAPPRNYPLR